ncbi:DegT/DnrJ/EryC1/StrS family aminotransferase [Pelosinus sp. sgz500959]|uniref:DegT/DnrJ/EryC1/StrS family aminotransferase n=1 Tax=Pelosinus sp. sgz500959 TaxID=3242472 RepID=UPI003672FE63
MRIPLVDLQQQVQNLKVDILNKTADLLDQGSFIMGLEVNGLEDSFSSYLEVKYAISCNSGTDALILILEAMDIGAGDEVITSPFTFFATAECISRVGAIPVFIDVDPNTMNIDPTKIEKAITSKTKAILPVHIFGQPADMEPIVEIAKRYNLFVIEDACQAIGATYTFSDGRVKKVGSMGDAAAFSFYPTKNLGAYGDGGMMTTNDDKLAQVIKALRVHGSGMNGKQAYEQLTGEIVDFGIGNTESANSTIYDPTKYYNFLIGMNSRLDAMQAAILQIKIKYLNQWNQARKRLSMRYTAGFEKEGLLETGFLIPQETLSHVESVYHLYIVKCEEREELSHYLNQKGIATGTYYPVPLHLQKVYQMGKHKLGYSLGDLPHSEWLSQRTMALPLFPEMTVQQQDYIINSIKEFYTRRGK